MPVTDPHVLPPDVHITPLRELAPAVRERLRGAADRFAISRPGGRHPSKIVDRESARLLELFRRPRGVVDAVVEYGGARGLDPRALLRRVFPLIRDCCNAGFLVPASSPEAQRLIPMLRRGDRVRLWRVARCVQVLEDSELYQVTGPKAAAALKILRPGAPPHAHAAITNEARVLRRLGGRGTPEVLDVGTIEDRDYLVMSWCPGVSPVLAAAELRESAARESLLRLCGSIAGAYARLHARGVVHGDVDPRNLLTAADGSTTILDFGLARTVRGGAQTRGVPRAGAGPFQDPEYARALLAGRSPPPATRASDQYALGALLYLLVTGQPYLDFPLRQRPALRYIATAPPLSFAQRRMAPWPPVERVLRRALSKSPAARYRSVAALARALHRALHRGTPCPSIAGAGSTRIVALEAVCHRMLVQLGLDGPALADGPGAAPTASVTFGAAGIAFALYRVACIREDASLLSLADAWLAKAERDAERDTGFYSPGTGVTAELVGTTTPYHSASGLHLVRALISQAMGDTHAMNLALHAFILASRGVCRGPDLTLGRAGTLLGCALLVDALPDAPGAARAALRKLGDGTLATVWRTVRSYPGILESTVFPMGMAHGWAGVLYATLRWCDSTEAAIPPDLARRLSQLAGCAEPAGRGVRWASDHLTPDGEHRSGYVAGWCNGSAGMVMLWTFAHRMFRRPAHLQLATLSAWHAWEDRDAAPSLCCGLAGRAYALLNLYRHTGDTEWLERARILAERAARAVLERTDAPRYPWSLFKGDAGVAVLAADLRHPEAASTPMFEEEGWPKPQTA